MPIHIIFTDTDGKIVLANPAAEQMTGYSQEEMMGATPKLWGGLMEREYYDNLWDTIKNKSEVFRGEIINKKKSGQKYLARVMIKPVLINGQLVGFLGVEENITEFKRLQENLNQSTLELESIYKLSRMPGQRVEEFKRSLTAIQQQMVDFMRY